MFAKWRESRAKSEKIIEKTKTEAPLELEKGDLKAIIIAAFITLFPIVLVFAGILGLAYWLLFGRF